VSVRSTSLRAYVLLLECGCHFRFVLAVAAPTDRGFSISLRSFFPKPGFVKNGSYYIGGPWGSVDRHWPRGLLQVEVARPSLGPRWHAPARAGGWASMGWTGLHEQPSESTFPVPPCAPLGRAGSQPARAESASERPLDGGGALPASDLPVAEPGQLRSTKSTLATPSHRTP
jgi:hypothetical protein